jgi:xylan 1,4-beta-xylosidase
VTNLESYLMLYNTTARAIKAVDSLLSVGGPSSAELGWIPEFIAATAGGAMPASFLSSHAYPTDARKSAGGSGNITRTSFEEALYAAAAQAAAAELPFVMTEASAGWMGNAYDSVFAGSWIVHMAHAFLGVPNVPTMSYWSVSDVFEEQGMESTPWSEVFGIQTKYGVPKPAYRALQMLRALPATGLPVSVAGAEPVPPARSGPAARATATSGTVDVIAAVDASLGTTVSLHALLTNFNANIEDQENATTGLPIATESSVSLTFSGLPPGAALPSSATVQLLDDEHGWAKKVWLAAGSPAYPSRQEVQAELAGSLPAVLSVPLSAGSSAGSVQLTVPALRPYAVAYVKLDFTVQQG